jgi:hypothetical protein
MYVLYGMFVWYSMILWYVLPLYSRKDKVIKITMLHQLVFITLCQKFFFIEYYRLEESRT